MKRCLGRKVFVILTLISEFRGDPIFKLLQLNAKKSCTLSLCRIDPRIFLVSCNVPCKAVMIPFLYPLDWSMQI
jgi:hypothetical protein